MEWPEYKWPYPCSEQITCQFTFQRLTMLIATKLLLLITLWYSNQQVNSNFSPTLSSNAVNSRFSFFFCYPKQQTSALPQECLDMFERVGKALSKKAAIAGAETFANAINDSVFTVFEEYIKFFREEVQRISSKQYIEDSNSEAFNELQAVALGMIVEFGARERQTYMRAAFTQRNIIKYNLSIADGLKLIKKGLFDRTNWTKLISDAQKVFHRTFKRLMQICDQSLTGLVGLIEVFEGRMKAIQVEGTYEVQKFEGAEFNKKEEGGIYTRDERMKYSEKVEEMKKRLTERYFNYEIGKRLKTKNLNYYAVLNEKIKAAGAEEADIKKILTDFSARSKKYQKMHGVTEIYVHEPEPV